MIKILGVGNLGKFIFPLLIICFTQNCYSQSCGFQQSDKLEFYKDYEIDTLLVDVSFEPVLDHAIAVLDTFDIQKIQVWLYYLIVLTDNYNKSRPYQLQISLRQGRPYDILLDAILNSKQDHIAGAFCYKGYTFFVLYNPNIFTIFNSYFKPSHKVTKFPAYYGIAELNELGKKLNFDSMLKQVYLFYFYKDGKLEYNRTTYKE